MGEEERDSGRSISVQKISQEKFNALYRQLMNDDSIAVGDEGTDLYYLVDNTKPVINQGAGPCTIIYSGDENGIKRTGHFYDTREKEIKRRIEWSATGNPPSDIRENEFPPAEEENASDEQYIQIKEDIGKDVRENPRTKVWIWAQCPKKSDNEGEALPLTDKERQDWQDERNEVVNKIEELGVDPSNIIDLRSKDEWVRAQSTIYIPEERTIYYSEYTE